ncbi:MAG: LysR family transcriptional regulator [Thermobacillus sp.]|uniref:Transcriptional regulator n=1 Tax=Thermobacillus composti (strain DSM 18247 / JCM 13945 / KWC4) TaxID=717605 RepID=L0EF79_THECK|nr:MULTISPECIES: LysR family transcriptional regulator [Thermobacillus]AGA57810.1 transcriptional regulator [Thermobacillus composti KWC4]REK56745.1 MAG: LysR family transcriptional regulator [Thermobacillus sp.]
MDIRQLRYFLAVAEEGQVTRAARKLNMEQPPLSRQLRMMEEELGVDLFDRSGRRMTLTPAGERLRSRAEQLLRLFGEIVTEVKELHEGITGTLSIGAVVSCVSLLPPRIKQFRETYPGVTFKITEGDHELLGDRLSRRAVELVVARLPFEAPDVDHGYEILPLPSEPFEAVIPEDWLPHPAPGGIRMRELAEWPFLTLRTDRTKAMHERIVSECRRHGFEPRIIAECSSVAVISSLLSVGLGVALLPRSVLAAFPPAGTKTIRLADSSLSSEVGILWLKDRYLSRSARLFIDSFREGG